MELLTHDDYRKLAGLKRPEIDPKIEMLIAAANAHVTAYLNYTDKTTEYINVTRNRNTYFLDSVLADGIISVTRRKSPDQTYEPVYSSDYFLEDGGKLVFDIVPPAGYYEVVLSNGELTVTDDIKNAVFMLVNYWDKNEYRDSRNFGGESVTFTTQNTGMPKHIRTILELYRNI